jgi:hypothetical protein
MDFQTFAHPYIYIEKEKVMFGGKRERFLEFLNAKGSIATDPEADPGSRMVARANLVEYAKELESSKNLFLRSRQVIDKLTEYSLAARDVAIQQEDLTDVEAHNWWGEVSKHLIHIEATDL